MTKIDVLIHPSFAFPLEKKNLTNCRRSWFASDGSIKAAELHGAESRLLTPTLKRQSPAEEWSQTKWAADIHHIVTVKASAPSAPYNADVCHRFLFVTLPLKSATFSSGFPPSCLNFLMLDDNHQALAALPLGRDDQVPREGAGVCRRPGSWPAKLISHSPGTHNASKVSMGINGRSERERERERATDRGGREAQGSENIQGAVLLSLSGDDSGYSICLGVYFFLHTLHFIMWTVMNQITSRSAIQVRTQWTQ